MDRSFYILLKLMDRSDALLGFCKSNCFFSGFLDAGSLQRGNLHNLAAQFLFQFIDMDLITGFFNQIHHIDSHDHRNAKLHDLCGQIQVTLDIGTVNDIDDSIGSFMDQIVSGYYFLKCIGRKGINSGKVCDDDIFMAFQFTFFFLYRYAGPVTNKLVGSCQCIK